MFGKHFRWHGAALVVAVCAARAQGSIMVMDQSLIADPKERAKVSAALETLQKSPNDLPALEVVLQTLPQVAETIGITAIYRFDDPLKTEVCKVIQAPASVEVLAQAVGKGSDLAAFWGCRRIASQAMNADSPLVRGAGGVIDAGAQGKLKAPLLDLLKRKDGKVRAAAVQAVLPMIDLADRSAFLKPLLKDDDVQVEGTVVFQLAMMRSCEKDMEDVVTGFMQKEDPDLLVACCWWWSMRSHTDTSITEKQEAALIKLGGDSHDMVRRQIADAVSEYATAEHPGLTGMLLKIADGDPDEIARGNAVYALRNYRTLAVHEKLLGWSREGQPGLVRDAAQRLLREYNW